MRSPVFPSAAGPSFRETDLAAAVPLPEHDLAESSPTRLRPADLLRLTDESGEDVLAGRYDRLLPAEGRRPVVDRWAVRLAADDEVDIWLISWTPDKSTRLHDHGGSLGALTVLSGALAEYRWTGTELRHRVLAAGDQAAFPIGWVHDVVRAPERIAIAGLPDPGPLDPTLSVHAYSPPLTAMSYYEVTGNGRLRRTHTALTAGPEGEL